MSELESEIDKVIPQNHNNRAIKHNFNRNNNSNYNF